MSCSGLDNKPKSTIPGNIGIVKCKALVWDHDPFQGRPHQQLSFPFSSSTAEQMRASVPESLFEAGAALLRPTLKLHDMYVCTINKDNNQLPEFINPSDPTKKILLKNNIDLVGSLSSGVSSQIASSRLPGGRWYECDAGSSVGDPDACIIRVPSPGGTREVPFIDPLTGKSIFPHQLWRHAGNIFSKTVVIHPSEYTLNTAERQAAKKDSNGLPLFFLEEIHAAAQWDYVEHQPEKGRISIWPYQITKQPPDIDASRTTSHHWVLEKWLPIWQGQDFVVSVERGDKELEAPVDILSTSDDQEPNDERQELAYLMYNPSATPTREDLGVGNNIVPWVDNISNEAFYTPPAADKDGHISQDAIEEAKRSQRSQYDWRFQNYILIEVGVNDPVHNYFIEIVKGRQPRLLHVGEEWDHPDRLKGGVLDTEGFTYIVKCRELSKYEDVSCDELFKKNSFRLFVRSQLGRLIITFEGYEDRPWVIQRKDQNPRSVNFDDKILIPMVVPSARVRIYGGNISCKINYSPLEFAPSATIPFPNKQADTREAKNRHLYMTFSHMGNSIQYTKDIIKRRFFSDEKFKFDKIGYDSDAYACTELIQNAFKDIPLYEIFTEQYQTYGKGWYHFSDIDDQRGEVKRDPITQLPEPRENKNLLNPRKGGVPHRLSIVNLRTPGKIFQFGLQEQADKNYPYSDYVSKWDVGIRLQAGSINMPPADRESLRIDDSRITFKRFNNHVTPIATQWRIIVLGGGKPFEGKVQSFDIAPLITKVNDSWSAEDFTSVNHEMQMKCYIPQDPPISDDKNKSIYTIGQKLLKLHDKAFYLTVSYWWDIGIGKREVIGNTLNKNQNKSPENNDLLIQMTGVAYGAELEKSNNKLYMNFTIKDYMSVLKNQFIFNSPFFDGVQDVQAVYDLAKLAQFDDDMIPRARIDRRPLSYLQKVLSDNNEERKFFFNGEESRCERYDLPGSYNTLVEPAVKFPNGESFETSVKKIAELSSKCIYFDRWGVLRFETLPAVSAAFASSDEKIEFKSVFDFVTSPFPFKTDGENNDSANSKDFKFDPAEHAAHLVYNSIRYQRSVEDCINQIVLFTAGNDILAPDGTRGGGFIIEGYTFFEQIWNPESEGFLGYRKPFYQSNGVFGGEEGVKNGLSLYAKMKYPPVSFQFETYGVPGLKALDIVTLDGNYSYITEISHEIDPSTNRWWMSVSTEWLKNFTGDLGFLKPRDSEPPPEDGEGGEGGDEQNG